MSVHSDQELATALSRDPMSSEKRMGTIFEHLHCYETGVDISALLLLHGVSHSPDQVGNAVMSDRRCSGIRLFNSVDVISLTLELTVAVPSVEDGYSPEQSLRQCSIQTC